MSVPHARVAHEAASPVSSGETGSGTVDPAQEVAPAPSSLQRLRNALPEVRSAFRQIVGIPDYERYLAHQAAHHPHEPVLSRREFFACAIDRKYTGKGPRCC